MNPIHSSTSEARQYDVPNYRWARSSDGICTVLTGHPPPGWGTAFTPKNYSLPGYFPPTNGFIAVLVRDMEIRDQEFYSFASQFGPIIRARYLTDPNISTSEGRVTYAAKHHAYQCFDELYHNGYNVTITIVGALSAQELQGLNEMQLTTDIVAGMVLPNDSSNGG